MKVTFLNAFKAIPAGSTIDAFTDVSRLNGVTLDANAINALLELNVVSVSPSDDVLFDCECCADFEEAEVVPTPFAPNYSSVSYGKITQAIIDDKNKYFLDESYSFYNVEKKEFVDSKLLNTASHIGRIASGFAVPANSTAKKKFNRLEKLNEVYGLGLSRSDITDATGFSPRSAR